MGILPATRYRSDSLLDRALRRGYYRRCRHRSHRWPYFRTCWNGLAYDGYCQEHNRTCYHACGDKGDD